MEGIVHLQAFNVVRYAGRSWRHRGTDFGHACRPWLWFRESHIPLGFVLDKMWLVS